jgi:hypothetical protein
MADHLAADATTPLAVATCAQARPDLTEALWCRLMRIGPMQETSRTVSSSLSRPLGEPLHSGHHCPGALQALRNDSTAGGSLPSLLHLRRTVRTSEPTLAREFGGSREKASGEPQHVDAQAGRARTTDESQDQLLPWDAVSIVTAYDWSGILTPQLHKRRQPHGAPADLKNVAHQAATSLAHSDAADQAAAVVGRFLDPANAARPLLETQAHTSAQVKETAARVEA